MKIGLVGYQGSGKSTLFELLTEECADPALSHTTQAAMAMVPDSRVAPLCEIYTPKKVTLAALELVDTPGLSRTDEGNAPRLAQIREAGCLVVVVATYDGSDLLSDLNSFEEDLLLADLEILSGRIERLEEGIKKPRPDRDQLRAELEALEPLAATLEEGSPLREANLSDEQIRLTRAFQFLTQKPRLIVVNVADDEDNPQRFSAQFPADMAVVAAPLRIELELAQMDRQEREEFVREMGLAGFDRDGLLRKILDVSGQILFFTVVGAKEFRAWTLRNGATAVEAAGQIHTDMARGFIRAETMSSEELIRLGSEREMKAHNLVRQEPKDYVVQDGDVIKVKFSV